MSLAIHYRPIAQGEFEEAVVRYEDAKDGLGTRFTDAVQEVMNEIADHPQRYPMVDGDVREAPVHGFPFCIYYRVRGGRLVILAVYHQSRDPDGWRGRT
jgi:plasmid stabilization system protein ParE